jgi:ABC-type transport system involved in cytochrome c biogenesis ATPase subunit
MKVIRARFDELAFTLLVSGKEVMVEGRDPSGKRSLVRIVLADIGYEAMQRTVRQAWERNAR